MRFGIHLLFACLAVFLSGCAFLTRSHPLHLPTDPGYAQYLEEKKSVWPIVSRFCERFGNPDGIEIGMSGGYFVWKNPRILLSVKYMNTAGNVYLDIPPAYNYLVGPQTERFDVSCVSAGLYLQGEVPSKIGTPVCCRKVVVTPKRDGSDQALRSSSYSVERFERVTGDEFAYAFKIVFSSTNGVELAAAQRVKRELRASVEEDYRAACPDARGESVQIDFPEFSMKGNVVEGRAEITRIAVTSLTYDDVTQKGVISVRIGASSFEKARAWVRKNIETIVRDKNIALTTGKVPADKRFFLGAERVLEGNVLQIEFETE